MNGKRIAITGTSGPIGSALSAYLSNEGWAVADLRWDPTAPGETPSVGALTAALTSSPNVICLNVDHPSDAGRVRPRTVTLSGACQNSQRTVAALLDEATANLGSSTRVVSVIDALTTSSCAPKTNHLPETPLPGPGQVQVTLATVLADHGLVPFATRWARRGLCGPVGDGQQWVSWISEPDAVRAIAWIAARTDITGRVDVASPLPVRQREFALALGRSLRRPVVVPINPGLFRALAPRVAWPLLESVRLCPTTLTEAGFTFTDTNLDQLLDRLTAAPKY